MDGHWSITGCRIELRARARINSQSWRSDLVQIWPIRLSKTAGIASYFEEFAPALALCDRLTGILCFPLEPEN